MFNRNGSNNGNGNGTRTPHWPPGTATGTSPTPQSSPSTTCCGTGSRPPSRRRSASPSTPALASQRKGRGGRVFDYLEGHVVIEQANRIFGYGGWGYELAGDVTLRRIETVDTQTGEVTVSQGYSAPVRVTVSGALPRTDLGVHPVAEDTLDGHDTAMKGAVTDGMKRAFRSFGVQFGNGFYGDQAASGNSPQPQRVPAQANGRSGQSQASRPIRQAQDRRNDVQARRCASGSSRSPPSRAFDEDQVRTAVVNRTGKSIEDLTAAELGPLVEAAANKLNGRCSRRRPPSPPVESDTESSGAVSSGAAPLSIYRTTKEDTNDDDDR